MLCRPVRTTLLMRPVHGPRGAEHPLCMCFDVGLSFKRGIQLGTVTAKAHLIREKTRCRPHDAPPGSGAQLSCPGLAASGPWAPATCSQVGPQNIAQMFLANCAFARSSEAKTRRIKRSESFLRALSCKGPKRP